MLGHHQTLIVTTHQSAYIIGRRTETALLCVLDDLHDIVQSGHPAVLVSLDISAAFDSISHKILLERQESDFGVSGIALCWFTSYLTGRTITVAVGDEVSSTVSCASGVPQGSVLGPVLFLLYESPIARVLARYAVRHHVYADDLNCVCAFSVDGDTQSNIYRASYICNS